MRRNVTTQEREALEALIDKTSLHQVLNAIAGICEDKAEHMRTNWQDQPAANEWARHAHALERRAGCAQVDGL